ncbi:MAG: ParA family protein [bacterium]|nr:ParA family protein [bacterium]
MTTKKEQKYGLPLRELALLLGKTNKETRVILTDKFEFNAPSYVSRVPAFIVRQLLEPLPGKVSYGFKTIAFMNLKGGVGKTVSAASTATRAVQYGFKTCMLDMDMQASLSLLFNCIPQENDPIFIDVWQDPANTVPGALKKIEDSLYMLPSALENGLLDSTLSKPAYQKNAVRDVCNVLKENQFDLTIIDCPPSLGTAVISTICAADIIVVPLGHDYFSLKGLNLTLQEMESICDAFGLKKPEVKVLFTRYDKREKMTKNIHELIKKDFSQFLTPGVIRTSSDFSKAIAKGETIFASSRKSNAKADYDVFVKHILEMN